MPLKIEAVQIQNFRTFKAARIEGLGNLCALVGANGSGKSTFFDIFSFLKDALNSNVSKAIDRRGGFREVASKGSTGPICITLKFRETEGRLATYTLEVGASPKGPGAIVVREILSYRRGSKGKPWHFLDFSNGQGEALVDDESQGTDLAAAKKEKQTLASPDILAIKGLGQLQKFRVASELRTLIENWHISDFKIDPARQSQEDGHAEHLNRQGDNLALVAQYLYNYHPEIWQRIIGSMTSRIPGVTSVETRSMDDGRIALRFQDGSFADPFMARHVSDGTIKMFAYLVLLNDPAPFPLLAVEEPENQLYPELMPELVDEFRDYANRGGQVFISTHSPELLDGLRVDEVAWLHKENGCTTLRKASESPLLVQMVEAGEHLGTLWRQGFFKGAFS